MLPKVLGWGNPTLTAWSLTLELSNIKQKQLSGIISMALPKEIQVPVAEISEMLDFVFSDIQVFSCSFNSVNYPESLARVNFYIAYTQKALGT